MLGDNYVRTCLEGSKCSSFFKYEEYRELIEDIINVLNQGWKGYDFYRTVCGKILTGALPVEQKEILLINGAELYDRRPTMDLHYERFGFDFSATGLPNFKNKYKKKKKLMSVSKMKPLLAGLAKTVTQKLKDANEIIKPSIVRSLMNF